MSLVSLLKEVRKPRYATLNRMEIDEKNILHNIRMLQKLQPNADIFPVLKSNAYGHGLAQVCHILEKTNVKMVVIDSFPEAQIVYGNSSKKVLLLGEASLESYKYCQVERTEFVVYNIETLQKLITVFTNPNIHLFVNTGMHREGISDIKTFLQDAKKILVKAHVIGVCSHLASADMNSPLTKKQEKCFFDAVQAVRDSGYYPQHIHLGNSAGVFILSNKQYTAFRPGITLYGYNVFEEQHLAYLQAEKLKPALRVLSTIVSLQRVKKGETVSYAETFRAKKNTNIAIIPFGYYEGIDRRLSNGGCVRIQGENCPIVGRVCMNLTCIDVGTLKVAVGDEVEVISNDRTLSNSIQAIAQKEGTISYEVLVKLQSSIRREIV